MKFRTAIAALVCIAVAANASAAPKKNQPKAPPEPEAVFGEAVDFSYDLAELQAAALSGKDSDIPRNQLLVIDGMVRSITVRSEDPSTFIAEAEIADGAWKGLDKVELYKCYVVFKGPEFAALFGKDALPERRIPVTAKVLVIGRYVGLASDYSGSGNVAVLNVYKVRRID